MISLKKNSSYINIFTNELSTYLTGFLDELINNKRLLSSKEKVNSRHTKNEDNYVYTIGLDNIERYQKIKFRISTNEITIFKKIKKKLNVILKVNNNKLNLIIKRIERNNPELLNENTDIFKIIKYIFVDKGYEYKISKANEKKIAYMLIKELGIKTCPYCNRNYISFIKNNQKQARPQLDHFYPKSIFPFLACSFYNLIPSCSACNLMKSDDNSYEDEKSNKLINPYNIKENDFKFSYILNDLKITEISSKKDITFEYEDSINILLETKYEKNNEYFQLEEIYQNHKDIVIELILKEINYPESYIEELITNNFGTKEEIYRFLFSNYLNLGDLHKKPLSKLTRDIVVELGILDKIELLIVDKRNST